MEFEHPLDGIFARMPVKILALNASGALIEHDRRLWYASRMPLEFTVEGRHVTLESEVVSSWIETYADPTTKYRSGIRFINLSRQITGLLEQLTGVPSKNGDTPHSRPGRPDNDS